MDIVSFFLVQWFSLVWFWIIEHIIDIPNAQTVSLTSSGDLVPFGYVQYRSITSICININKWIDVHSRLSQIVINNSCSDGEIRSTFIRKCGTFSYQESIYIYKGTSTTTTPIYSMSGCEEGSEKKCIAPGVTYTIIMKDSWGNGWSTGSSLTIVYRGSRYEFSLGDGPSGSATLPFVSITSLFDH